MGVELGVDSKLAVAIEPDKSALVDGLLTRAKSVVSGRLGYRVCDSNGLKAHLDFILSGSNWRVDDREFHTERINSRGQFAEVHRNTQPDGSVLTSATLGKEVSVEERNPRPPYFAGSLWYPSTVDYVWRHKSDAQFAGTADVGGYPCAILDWTVSAKDRWAAFSSTVPPLKSGGVLRLYVSKDLGYALPRVEYLAPDGAVATRFDSTDFWCVGRGIFFPKSVILQTFPRKGQLEYSLEYAIEAVEDINNPIPDDAFHAVLPAGTSVADAQGAPPLHFETDTGLIELKEITDADFVRFKNVPNSTDLKINSRQITDATLVRCRGMDQLRSMDLSFTQVTDNGLAPFAGFLTGLECLELAHTLITDETIERLKGAAHLRTLNLTATRVSDAGLVPLRRLQTLQVLLLDRTRISAAGLTNLEGLTELQHLGLSDNKRVNDVGMVSLKHLTKLRYLTLRDSSISDASIPLLKTLKDLRTIDLRGTRVTEAGHAELRNALPKLKVEFDAGETH